MLRRAHPTSSHRHDRTAACPGERSHPQRGDGGLPLADGSADTTPGGARAHRAPDHRGGCCETTQTVPRVPLSHWRCRTARRACRSARATSHGEPARAYSPRPRSLQRSRGRAFPGPPRDCIGVPAPPATAAAPVPRRVVRLAGPRTAIFEDPRGSRPERRRLWSRRFVEEPMCAPPQRRGAPAPASAAPPTSVRGAGASGEPGWRV